MLVVACGGPATSPTGSAPVSRSDASSGAPSARPTGAVPTPPSTGPVLAIQVIDVRTGERFTLGGFPGKTVIVEGMAVW
jgi:hypothetical protein